MYSNDLNQEEILNQVYHETDIIRKPLSGIVSGYHELPYILISPDTNNPSYSIEINGTIKVSPRFVIPSGKLGESFGDIFDPETFNKDIETRMFSFIYEKRKNVKLENAGFQVNNVDEKPEDHLNRIHDQLLKEENIRTGLIFGPKFRYYPVSIDRFISEIIEREFRI